MPRGARETDEKVLAYGEVTGHAHRIDTGQLMTVGDTMYVWVERSARLTHEEHHTIELPPGAWQVVRQREYTPRRPVYVED